MRPPQVGRTTILACLLEAAMALGRGCVAPWSGWRGWRARSAAGLPLTLKGLQCAWTGCRPGAGIPTSEEWWCVRDAAPLHPTALVRSRSLPPPFPRPRSGHRTVHAHCDRCRHRWRHRYHGARRERGGSDCGGIGSGLPHFRGRHGRGASSRQASAAGAGCWGALLCGLAATFAWEVAAKYAALAAVPLLLAGKRRA